MSYFSPDRPKLEARIYSLFCPRCTKSLLSASIEYRRTRIDVFCSCGQMTSFTAPALRNDYHFETDRYGD